MEENVLNIAEISALEDSCYFVNRAVEALNLQMRRLEEYEVRSQGTFWEYLSDVHFYIVALKRLRQAMLVVKKIDRIKHVMNGEFDAFDTVIADAMQMRHILEHVDEYIKNLGKNSKVKNETLYTIEHDESALKWAGLKFERNKIHTAAISMVKKYRAVTSHEFRQYKLQA